MTHTTPAHHHGKVWRAFCFDWELAFVSALVLQPGIGGPV
jgi:hypothetical protein